MKEVYNILLNYIEKDNQEQEDNQMISILESDNHEYLREILQIVSKISENHHRNPAFYANIEKIILQLVPEIKDSFTNSEIFNLFKKDKRILLFLFKNKILDIDKSIINHFYAKSSMKYSKFFSKEIELFTIGQIKSELKDNEQYEAMRCKGENESFICQLIRDDSIDEFVIFVNQRNFPLNSIIEKSVFETNPFLLKVEKTTLIEYAAFFGSIQIFQYLRMNGAELSPSLWLYAIHSNNAELIHILENCNVKPPNGTFNKCLSESIKCHHNNIANYIINTYIFEDKPHDELDDFLDAFSLDNSKNTDFDKDVVINIIRYYNYEFFPVDSNQYFIFHYLCKYNYINLVKLYLQNKKINVNFRIVFKKQCFINRISKIKKNLCNCKQLIF